MRLLLALLSLVCGVLGLGAEAAQAHAMPNSAVYLDFGPASVRVDAVLPWAELKYALPPAFATPPRNGPGVRDLLRTYALAHIGARAPDGRPWTAAVESADVLRSKDHTDAEVRLILTPPPGAPASRFLFRDDAVIHVVMSHVVLVFARNDYRSGAGGAEPRLIAVLQNPTESAVVDLPAAKAGSSFGAAFLLGMRHIAEGTDHLLFLFTLLLPAPLLSRQGRWQGVKPPKAAVVGLLSTVTAFTVGHSLTLLFGALLDIRVPQQPVEVAIAASILFAAIAAWRPLLLEGKAGVLIAGGFGLVHGMSFAAAIGDYLLSPLAKAWAVLGFNLGIEAVQALVVLAVAPVLLLLARTRAYPPFRLGAAAASGAAALGWMVVRLA